MRHFTAAVVATLLASVLNPLSLSDAAAAPNTTCEKPELRAEGRRSNPGSPEYKERMARSLSVSKWEQLAQELYGSEFAQWQMAKERRIECEHYDEPGFDRRVSCVAIAQPCDKP